MIDYYELSSALYYLNKKAKQYRDASYEDYNYDYSAEEYNKLYEAKEKKEKIYEIKNLVLEKLRKQKSLKYLGYHKTYNRYHGKTYWGCYKFCKISFHFQIPQPMGKKMKNLKEPISSEINWSKTGSVTTNKKALKIINKFLKTDFVL